MSEVRQFTVGADDEGIRLDRWFKRHLEGTSFTTIAKWARTGQLRVDGARATPGDRLRAGQLIRVPPDRKSTRLNSSHSGESRMPSSA